MESNRPATSRLNVVVTPLLAVVIGTAMLAHQAARPVAAPVGQGERPGPVAARDIAMPQAQRPSYLDRVAEASQADSVLVTQ